MTLQTREVVNLSKRPDQLESRLDIQLEEQRRRLRVLEAEIKYLHKAQTAIFAGLLTAVAAVIIALGMAFYTLDELDVITAKLDALGARVTSITAEVRGIGG